VTNARVFRKGVWGGKNGDLWPVYPTMKAKVHQASHHAAIYADIKLVGAGTLRKRRFPECPGRAARKATQSKNLGV